MYLIILEVKLQAKSGCFVNKAQVVYLFTNNVKKETTISFTKYLMANKINGFNVFKNNISTTKSTLDLIPRQNIPYVNTYRTQALFT